MQPRCCSALPPPPGPRRRRCPHRSPSRPRTRWGRHDPPGPGPPRARRAPKTRAEPGSHGLGGSAGLRRPGGRAPEPPRAALARVPCPRTRITALPRGSRGHGGVVTDLGLEGYGTTTPVCLLAIVVNPLEDVSIQLQRRSPCRAEPSARTTPPGVTDGDRASPRTCPCSSGRRGSSRHHREQGTLKNGRALGERVGVRSCQGGPRATY